METFLPSDKVYKLLLGQIGPTSPVQGLPDNVTVPQDSQAMQDLTTSYIVIMYYSALSNLYLQGLLPKNMGDMDSEMPRLKVVFDRTYTDFTRAAEWLAKNGDSFIDTSPAKQYYDEIRSMGENSVMDIPSAYSFE